MRTPSLLAALVLLCTACGTRGPLVLPPGPPPPPLFGKPGTSTPQNTEPVQQGTTPANEP